MYTTQLHAAGHRDGHRPDSSGLPAWFGRHRDDRGTAKAIPAHDAGRLTVEVPLGGTPTVLIPGVPDMLATAGRTVVTIAGAANEESATAPEPATTPGSTAQPVTSAPGSSLPATGGSTDGVGVAAVALALALLVRPHRLLSPAR